MKKYIWIPVLLLFFILFSCQKKNKEDPFPVAQEIENKISSAVNKIANGNVAEGAELLLDVILLTRPSEFMPEGFENKIIAAKEQFRGGNLNEGVGTIHEALLIITSDEDLKGGREKDVLSGEAYVQKEDEVPSLAVIVKDKIMSAKAHFKEGEAEEGIELILEALSLFGPKPK